MERGKRAEAIHGEIHLHEAIIQHIQSFLSHKEAAQTSFLCKSWYNACVTRPTVDLDQSHFQSCRGAFAIPLIADGFLESSKKIMRRYNESKLKIESFRFCMLHIRTDCFSLVNEFILDAMRLGACDLNVESVLRISEFDLPHEVLRSENLVRLSVSGCRIDREGAGGKVGFSKLKSLTLHRVCTIGTSTSDMIFNCPLIEELVLSKCTGIRTGLNPKGKTVELSSKWLFGIQSEGSIGDAQIRLYDNLKRLYLEMIQIDELLFSDMSRRFPRLIDLTLNQCTGFIGLQISSPSLEFLSIEHTDVLSAKIDVPSLCKFTFSGTMLPFLWFEAASREWVSDISATYMQNHMRCHWFGIESFLLKLNDFLMMMSMSKISLSLYFRMLSETEFDLIEHDPSLPKPEVENLMLSVHGPTSVCSSVLKGVFCICCPKFITQDWLPQLSHGREENSDMLKLLCKTLIDEQSKSCCIPSSHMSDMFGLEKVDVEVFEDNIAEWQPLLWNALVDAVENPEKKRKIRFKLGWRQNPSAH